ncbi:MAG TPA: hypothetical protein PLM79_13115 [Syntrophobacteraceae bacterium]|nr:hypothetical protein [Syntrophobacteraceae bacterium]
MASKGKKPDLESHHKKYLAPIIKQFPFLLRITEWKDYPAPVLVVKERPLSAGDNSPRRKSAEPDSGSKSVEIGFIAGEPQRLCLPIFRQIVERVRDRGGVPLDLQRFLSIEGLRLRMNLPLDEEAGSKLGLIFRLQLRVKEFDRIELMARRIARFTAEEASYWLSRTTHFGPDANRWAVSGMRIMLGGQPKDPAVERMLEKLRTGS